MNAIKTLVFGVTCIFLTACNLELGFSNVDLPVQTETPEFIEYGEGSEADQILQHYNFNGTAMFKKGNEIVIKKAYGFADKEANRENTVETRFRIFSLTKAFTAMAIVKLEQQGVINSFNDPVSDYLPDYPRGDEITLHHLLAHRSGIPDHLPLLTENKYLSPKELVAITKDKPLEFDPGTQTKYSNGGYVLLGYLLETITGLSYIDNVSNNILTPLNMINTESGPTIISGEQYALGYEPGFVPQFPGDMSLVYSAGVLSSNLEDMAKWAQSYSDHSLVPAAYNDIMFFATPEAGYGWGVEDIGAHQIIGHKGQLGGFTSFILMIPETETVMILLSNKRDENFDKLVQALIMNQLLDMPIEDIPL
ncbi:MAG: beta-lactamase family protein [Pseudomonadales bacterium]|nr:beta-lactamase family protein [Pseudomonadales bacterium]